MKFWHADQFMFEHVDSELVFVGYLSSVVCRHKISYSNVDVKYTMIILISKSVVAD
jgi:hypothetical protein